MKVSAPQLFCRSYGIRFYFDFLRTGCQGCHFVTFAWAEVRLEAIQPEIDRLRTEVAKSEDELSELKLKVEEKEQLFLNLADIVRIYEDSLRNPVDDTRVEERVQLMESGVGESTQV